MPKSDSSFTLVGPAVSASPIVLICEHASKRVPAPLRPSVKDRQMLASHWGWDIGAATVTREIAKATGANGVLANFSRLVCDGNRHPLAQTWIRTEVDGHIISFNTNLSPEEKSRRLRDHYAPYHNAVDRLLTKCVTPTGDTLLLSVHSFTPSFDGKKRTMEMGVLFDHFGAIGRRFAGELAQLGYAVALNKPYSGHRGDIYSACRHGSTHGVLYLELEIRQDLLSTAQEARATGRRVAKALRGLQLRESFR